MGLTADIFSFGSRNWTKERKYWIWTLNSIFFNELNHHKLWLWKPTCAPVINCLKLETHSFSWTTESCAVHDEVCCSEYFKKRESFTADCWSIPLSSSYRSVVGDFALQMPVLCDSSLGVCFFLFFFQMFLSSVYCLLSRESHICCN